MFMQLWHGRKAPKGDVKEFFTENFEGFSKEFYTEKASPNLFGDEPAAWRPFQLAFILLNIDGISNPGQDNWPERNEVVDLVWFPTGGGKTEAYLGIIAMTIIHRRRVYKEKGGGTAAIMRYTLRLLTLQQFQRATILIMALELVRRWGIFDLGKEPIFIGMWVGNDSLPNRLEDLEKEYKGITSKLESNRERDQKEGKGFDPQRIKVQTKIPFAACPWCGTSLYQDYVIDFKDKRKSKDLFEAGRIHLNCHEENCSFSSPIIPGLSNGKFFGPIPVSLCDEEIYKQPPALLFGTVDKFAQLAHKVSNTDSKRHKDSRRLFGKGNFEIGKPSSYIPPDLIIQDELHLLLGPLGSAVAVLECGIDQLCTRETKEGKKIRPKIISVNGNH